MTGRALMADLDGTFDRELQEVAIDAAKEYWQRMPELSERAKAFFFNYVDDILSPPLSPDEESKTERMATIMMLIFMAGREHALRGYRSPIPKEVPNDEMPPELEDAIEKMLKGNHD